VQANKDIKYERAFVVDEVALKRLNKIVTDQAGALTYKVSLSDGTVLHPSFEEIFGVANLSGRAIHKISGETDYRQPLWIAFSIDNSVWAKTLDFSIRGEERDVVFVSNRLDEWASSVSKGYSFLCFPNGRTIGIQIASWFGGVALLCLSSFFVNRWRTLTSLSLVLGIVLVVIAISFGWVVKYVFPRGIFAIGGGIARLQTYEKRQRRFSIGTIIGAIITVLLGILSNRLSR